jgi:hypothetical protein
MTPDPAEEEKRMGKFVKLPTEDARAGNKGLNKTRAEIINQLRKQGKKGADARKFVLFIAHKRDMDDWKVQHHVDLLKEMGFVKEAGGRYYANEPDETFMGEDYME